MKYNTLKEIDDLISKCQNTKNQDQYLKQILDAFEGYILKYLNFFQYGLISYKDKDIIGLIRMFQQKDNQDDTIKKIQKILTNYTSDDILSELQMMFIKCVKKYNKLKKGPSFTGFIYSYFKFMIRTWLKKLSVDMLNVHSICSLTDYISLEHTLDYKKHHLINNICFFDIKELTNLEKYILYLVYELQLKDYEIESIVNISRPHLNVIKNNAEKKIKGQLDNIV